MERELDQAWRQLEQIWQQTCQGWRDAKQIEFETRYWTAIDAETATYRLELRSLETVLANARQQVR